MSGTPHLVVAAIGIPGAWPCFAFATPFLAIAVLRWIIHRADYAVDRLFPHWEWEKRLGWLNLKNQRRAEAVLRWIGYFLYTLLAAALYGIVWAAQALSQLDRWSDPDVLGEISLKLPVLLICLGLWLVYLGLELLPKLRRRHETEELEKFRARRAGRELERDFQSESRLAPTLEKPRADTSARPGRFGPRN